MKQIPDDEGITTGIKPLDNILGNGFQEATVILIYGEATTGKTTLCINTALHHLKQTPTAQAIYIDSDRKLNIDRLNQMFQHTAPHALHRIHIHTPESFSEQAETLEQLPETTHNDLLIVDSITGLYRVTTGSEQETYQANKELNRQLGYITEMARKTGVTAILTGQVRSILDTKDIEPVAPRLLEYWATTVLKLEKTSKTGQRQATLEKPRRTHSTLFLELTDEGVTASP